MSKFGHPVLKCPSPEYLAECVMRFKGAMNLEGLGSPSEIIADGKIHRFYVQGDKNGSQNGWYVFYGTAGAYGSWRTGFRSTWPRGMALNTPIQKNLKEVLSAVRIQQKIERDADHIAASLVARRKYSSSVPASPDHLYLQEKLLPHHEIRQSQKHLQVPLFDFDGNLWNLQTITPAGSKFFLKGGRVKGLYSPIGGYNLSSTRTFAVCEGWATGASIHQHLNYPVLCAMNAGNLVAVAEGLRHRAPAANIIIVADNDRFTQGNPGVTKALEAARAAKAAVIIPQFPEGSTGTDYNDLMKLEAGNA